MEERALDTLENAFIILVDVIWFYNSLVRQLSGSGETNLQKFLQHRTCRERRLSRSVYSGHLDVLKDFSRGLLTTPLRQKSSNERNIVLI